jgi:hypothetical protein
MCRPEEARLPRKRRYQAISVMNLGLLQGVRFVIKNGKSYKTP